MLQSKKIKIFIAFLIILAVTLTVFYLTSFVTKFFFSPSPPAGQTGITLPQYPLPSPDVFLSPDDAPPDIEIIAQNLSIPWALAWLPSGQLLVTERAGRLLLVTPQKNSLPISGVEHIGEGGLLGLAVHPDFSQNNFIYLYLTTKTSTGLINRVDRYQLNSRQLSNRRTIIDGIPGARFHDGGRLAFGPDGYLYITTGDAGQSANAQNLNSLAGKILRLKDDGAIPPDNPFNSPVYSLGHRNPQGLAWDEQGRLWSTEHGRSGIKSGLDELNLIKSGSNYGWPTIQGDETQNLLTSPSLHSGPDITWAPAGAAYLNNSIFFGGLRGAALYQAQITPDGSVEKLFTHFYQEFGRLRDVAIGPDGWLYFTTSNTDGRGEPNPGDDKIIRVNPDLFSTSP